MTKKLAKKIVERELELLKKHGYNHPGHDKLLERVGAHGAWFRKLTQAWAEKEDT